MKHEIPALAYALGNVDAALIAEAELPEGAKQAPAARPAGGARRVFESGWFAAAVSAVVALGVLTGIIMAGQGVRPPTGGTSPHGSAVTDLPEDPHTAVTESDTETVTNLPVASPHIIPEGFTVTDKVYTYRDDTVLLLHVTNERTENVFFTIQAYATDESGNQRVIGRQRIQGFPGEYGKYLMFRTSDPVTTYTYTITAEPYEGECPELLYRSEFVRIYESEAFYPPDENGEFSTNPADWEEDRQYPCLILEMSPAYLGSEPAEVTNCCIIFDNRGEIFRITDTQINYYSHYQDNGSVHMPFYSTKEETLTIPEELTGDGVTAICVFSVAYSDRIIPELNS